MPSNVKPRTQAWIWIQCHPQLEDVEEVEFDKAELEGDLEAGIKLHPTNVLASKGMTVMEGDFENPPHAPFHCPPATSMVFFHRDGAIRRVRRHFAPRPEKGRHNRREE